MPLPYSKLVRKLTVLVALTLALVLASGDALAAKGSRSSGKKVSSSKKKRAKASTKAGRRGRDKHTGKRSRRGRKRASQNYDVADVPQPPRSSGIPNERVTEIQSALVKRGYLEGPPSGEWDDKTQDAVRDFQTDNKLPATGQTSAHFLKKLGVSKRPADGYATPVSSSSDSDKHKDKDKDKEKKEPAKNPEPKVQSSSFSLPASTASAIRAS